MADKPDASERTEEATPKKIEDALARGQTPFSRELPVFVSLVAILAILGLAASGLTAELSGNLAAFLDIAGATPLEDAGDAGAILTVAGLAAASFTLPIVAILAAAGVVGALAQNSPRIVGERIQLKLDRVSVAAGAKRIFGVQGVVEFLRSLFKFAVVGTVAVLLLRQEVPATVRAVFVDPAALPAQMLAIAMRLVSTVCAATIILVAADLVWTRIKWKQDLRMSRREVKDEMKQSEGDPLLKARIRSAQKDRSRRRMLGAVPRATVVIANPTHFAVALAYSRGEGGAPRVVAKGVDLVALRIRELAEAHDVPVVVNPPLARALYHAVEIDRFIPEDFYRAVAQVLYFVYSKDAAAAPGVAPRSAH